MRQDKVPRHGVEPIAARGYDAAGDLYERSRPGYPSAAIDVLVDQLVAEPQCKVLELAAGTGKLTRLVQGVHAHVIAVEPVAAMQKHLAAAVPSVPIVAAVAEAVPLAPEVVDAVVVGTAFHWFRGEEALSEIARVLRPDGGLALLWNNPDRRTPWVAGVWAAVDEHRGDVPGNRDGRWREAFDGCQLFRPLEHQRFHHGELLGREDILARVTSISFVAALEGSARRQLLERVQHIISAEPELDEGCLLLPYVTDLFWCRKR